MTFVDFIIIYVAFRIKQVVCDFFLQTSWMASVKGSPFNMGGAKALGLHAAIHAVFTLVLMVIFAPSLWWLALVDFALHGFIDKLKGAITNAHGWTYKDNKYWWAFGIDQEAHNLTHFAYVLLIVWMKGVDMSAALPAVQP
jgi:hypothetical protein